MSQKGRRILSGSGSPLMWNLPCPISCHHRTRGNPVITSNQSEQFETSKMACGGGLLLFTYCPVLPSPERARLTLLVLFSTRGVHQQRLHTSNVICGRLLAYLPPSRSSGPASGMFLADIDCIIPGYQRNRSRTAGTTACSWSAARHRGTTSTSHQHQLYQPDSQSTGPWPSTSSVPGRQALHVWETSSKY